MAEPNNKWPELLLRGGSLHLIAEGFSVDDTRATGVEGLGVVAKAFAKADAGDWRGFIRALDYADSDRPFDYAVWDAAMAILVTRPDGPACLEAMAKSAPHMLLSEIILAAHAASGDSGSAIVNRYQLTDRRRLYEIALTDCANAQANDLIVDIAQAGNPVGRHLGGSGAEIDALMERQDLPNREREEYIEAAVAAADLTSVGAAIRGSAEPPHSALMAKLSRVLEDAPDDLFGEVFAAVMGSARWRSEWPREDQGEAGQKILQGIARVDISPRLARRAARLEGPRI